MKKLKLKARNGILFSFDKITANDNHISFYFDWYEFGVGVNYRIGDSRRFFDVDILFLHLTIWF